MKRALILIVLIQVFALLGCEGKSGSKASSRIAGGDITVTPPGKPPHTETETETETETNSPAVKLDLSDWPKALQNKFEDGKLFGSVLCETGPKIAKKAGKADLSNIFSRICVDNAPSNFLGELFQKAYAGSAQPSVNVLVYDVNDIFATKFMYGYAVKTKMPSPSMFTDLPIYEELSKGLRTEDSLLMIRKVSEKLFPGKGSFREIIVEYDMPYAGGAGLYDKRKTESNTYLLSENSQDLNMTVENLSGSEPNEYYTETNGIVIGVKGDSGETYLVYVNDVNVINRFDVERLKRTILKLTEKLQEVTYNVAAK